MSTLSLKHIFKMYPNNSKGKNNKLDYAVKDFNLEILDGEFVVFVGPSGCGKSTTLRMIAGLEDITAGELYIDEELSNNKEPKDRNVAMVFQSYALYPNMTAYNNIAFALKMRKKEVEVLDKDGNKILIIDKKKIKSLIKNNKILNKRISQSEKLLELYKQKVDKEENKDLYLAKIDFEEKHILEITKELNKNIENIEYYSNNLVPKTTFIKMSKDEIDEKIQSVAEILEITKLLDRKPSDMSGGQRQRVALGRAMVREPKVFLLDEPLSNLDAKLRTAMRSEIVKLHEKVKTTFIYVTHDQVEAMTMGTKIVVMKDGLIMQVDTPTNLYDYPNNKFVAGFIGTPQMNFFEVTVKKVNRSLKITFNDNQELSFGLNKLRKINNLYLDGNEHKVYLGIRAEHLSLNKTGIKTKLSITEVLGNVTNLFVHLENDKKDFIVSVNDRLHYESGHELFIEFNPSKIHLFDYENELSIMEGDAK